MTRYEHEFVEITAFGHKFRVLQGLAEDLITLEREGVIYSHFWSNEIQDFKYYRIKFLPVEIFLYVEAHIAKQEFDDAINSGSTFEEALAAINNRIIADKVRSYGNYGKSLLKDGTTADLRGCYASFCGKEVEELICGGKPDRYEVLPVQPDTGIRLTTNSNKYKMIYDAFLDGYRTCKQLEIMVKFELDENVDELAGGDNLGKVIFNLIMWAERTGRFDELIKGAISHNPRNLRVQSLIQFIDNR
jgi:hypothetical protein